MSLFWLGNAQLYVLHVLNLVGVCSSGSLSSHIIHCNYDSSTWAFPATPQRKGWNCKSYANTSLQNMTSWLHPKSFVTKKLLVGISNCITGGKLKLVRCITRNIISNRRFLISAKRTIISKRGQKLAAVFGALIEVYLIPWSWILLEASAVTRIFYGN
jgi:hypothetical protein